MASSTQRRSQIKLDVNQMSAVGPCAHKQTCPAICADFPRHRAFCVPDTKVSLHRFQAVVLLSAQRRSHIKLGVNQMSAAAYSAQLHGIMRSASFSNQTDLESNERRGILRSAYA